MATFARQPRLKGWVYRAEVRRDGKRLTKRFSTLTQAKDWALRIESQIIEGSLVPKLKRHDLLQAIERYEAEILPNKKEGTQRLHRTQLDWFKSNFGSLRLSEITTSSLVSMRRELERQPFRRDGSSTEHFRQGSTLNRYFVPLLNLFRIAVRDWEWMQSVPTLPRLKESRGRTRHLRPEEARRIIHALDRDPRKDLRLISLISLTLGSRLFETCALKWEDIDFDNAVISFRETKNSQLKCLPIPENLYRELKLWEAQRANNSPYLFPTDRNSKRPHVYTKIGQGFARLTKRLDMADVSFHILRHSVGSWATQLGTNRKVVGELLGHQDLRTTDRYAHLDVAYLRPVVTSMEQVLQGDSQIVLPEKNLYEH